MVNNFQNIRESLIEESSEIQQHRRLAMELTFNDNQDEDSENKDDVHLAWEKETFQNLHILTALEDNLTPTVWPRDTLFQYYILLEAMANSIDERNYILRQLGNPCNYSKLRVSVNVLHETKIQDMKKVGIMRVSKKLVT
ncbi:unnamed protein product [Orchesella dallaii]|uniref:Uncharacterized protein n=1 Tax=Orchesella dallaii TaxID=48710 RepID=A0ABP1Q4B9_9HEXA